VIVSPSLDSVPPQHGQFAGDGSTTRSRGRCAGSGARTGLARVNGRTVLLSGAAVAAATSSSAAAVSSSSSCISNWSSSLRPRSAEAPNDRASSWRSAASDARPSPQHQRRAPRTRAVPHVRPAAPPSARRCRRGGSRLCCSRADRITLARSHARRNFSQAARRLDYPASSGRQVRCGFRQSIPSSI
jgi:hypothetical protein